MSLDDGWLPGWHHAPRQPPKDGQYYDAGFPARVTWHTMEGWLSVATTLGHPAPPQLWASPRTRLKVQSIPLIWGGFATYYQRGYPYDPDTVTNHVQVELEGFAGQTQTWPKEWLDWVADEVLVPIMQFYRHHGIAFDPVAGPHMPGEAMGGSAADDAPQRMSWAGWQAFNAQGGHRHVPGNGDRWDPGPLDALYIGRRALAVLDGSATPPVLPPPKPRLIQGEPMKPTLRTKPDGTPEVFDWEYTAGTKVPSVAYDFPAVPNGWGVACHEARFGNPENLRFCQLVNKDGRGAMLWYWWGQRAWAPVDRTEFHSLVVPHGIDVIVEAMPVSAVA